MGHNISLAILGGLLIAVGYIGIAFALVTGENTLAELHNTAVGMLDTLNEALGGNYV